MGDRVTSEVVCPVTECGFRLKFVKGSDGKMVKKDRILVAGHLMMCHAYSVAEAHRTAGLKIVT